MTVRTEFARPVRRIDHVPIPLSGSVRFRRGTAFGPRHSPTIIETDSRMTVTATEVVVAHTFDADDGEERARARAWTPTFPRDGV